jgi:uncharacterized membrane protein YdbT with pleckstrin-like domain
MIVGDSIMSIECTVYIFPTWHTLCYNQYMGDEKLVELIRKSHLFRRMRGDDVLKLAGQGEKVTLEKDQIIYHQGSQASFFYMIARGKIQHFYTSKDRIQKLGVLIEGDYIGLDTLFNKGRRISTAYALEPSELYRWRADALVNLFNGVHRVQAVVDMVAKSYKLGWNSMFSWFDKDEILYFVTRRHPAFLLLKLIPPLFLGLVSLLFFLLGGIHGMSIYFLIGGAICLTGIAWAVWNYFDWYNDYFFITNKRIVWLEKVIAFYESRHEVPLHKIRSVDYTTTLIARTLGYGNVIVNTFTDSIVMQNIGYPGQVADLVEEQIDRVNNLQKFIKHDGMRKTLRTRIGKEKPENPNERDKWVDERKKRSRWSTSFRMRLVEDDVVTYRRHWVVLLAKIAGPLAVVFGSWVLTVGWIANIPLFAIFSIPTAHFLAFLMFVGGLAWLVYEFVDWRNDIYRVTSEQLIDIERRPLGDEQKKTAPLDSILSLEVERFGLIGILLNFGNVAVNVSGQQFVFRGIYDPVTAQLDISTHMDAYRRKRRQDEESRGDERFLEWAKLFHEESTE